VNRFSIADTSTHLSTGFGFWIERLKRQTSFCLVLSGLLVVIGAVAEAQQPERIPRIGYLPSAGAPLPRQFKALQDGLRDLGYVEGKNIAIESRHSDGKFEPTDLVKELLQLKVDVLIAVDPTSLRAAKQATKNVPIIMVTNQDPVATGLVDDLARPSGNVTGIARLTRDLSGKRLELLKEIIPSISRVGVLWVRPTALGVGTAFQSYEPTAKALKIQLQSLQVTRPDPDLAGAIREAVQRRVQALITVSHAVLGPRMNQISDLTLRNRLPVMCEARQYVDAGCVMSYATDDLEVFRRVAIYLDKILKGAKPGDLPVEQPSKFELAINLNAAKQVGLASPPQVLARADRVIK
jgi:putative tryptophan/tyrosine transport system substrate-binding protein